MNAKKAKKLRAFARNVRQIELLRPEESRITYEEIAQRMTKVIGFATIKHCRRAVRFTTLQAQR